MATRMDPRMGGEFIVRRRPHVATILLFIIVLGLVVWFVIPRNHAWISITSAPEQTSAPAGPATPAGSVSGAAAGAAAAATAPTAQPPAPRTP